MVAFSAKFAGIKMLGTLTIKDTISWLCYKSSKLMTYGVP